MFPAPPPCFRGSEGLPLALCRSWYLWSYTSLGLCSRSLLCGLCSSLRLSGGRLALTFLTTLGLSGSTGFFCTGLSTCKQVLPLFLSLPSTVLQSGSTSSPVPKSAKLFFIRYIISMASGKELAEHIGKLETEQKHLLQQRKTVLRSLTAIRKSERYFKSQDDLLSPNKLTGQQLIRKKRKTNDGAEEVTYHPVKHEPRDKSDTKPDKDKPQQPHSDHKIPDSIQQRNRRMFGAMDQHLKKAKIKLASEEEQAKRKAELEQESILSQQQTVKAMKEEKRQLLAKTKGDQNKKKDDLAVALLNVENSLLETRFKQYVERLKGYIPTKTQPTIYWKPANFNDGLTKLLSDTAQHFKALQEKAVQQVRSISEPIAYSKSEYLTNKLTRHYRELNGCILTETKPQIYWRPVKTNQQLKKLQTKTAQFHTQKLQQSKQLFVKHPKPKQPSQQDASQSDGEHDSH